MKVAYATIVYKNRRQKYYLFLYKLQILLIFLFGRCFLFDCHFIGEDESPSARCGVPCGKLPVIHCFNLYITGF